MFLYISKYISSLGTDIISPMNEDANDIRSINYSNYHEKFGLFKFFISLYFFIKLRKQVWVFEKRLPSHPSGFTTPITFYESWFSLATESYMAFVQSAINRSQFMIPWKLNCRSRRQKWKNKPITMRVLIPPDRFQSNNPVFTGS